MRRSAKLVPLGVPQEIQQQQVGLAGKQARAAAYHLAVQAAYFSRAQHHNAVDARAVPALGEQHTVAQHVVLAAVECRKDFRAVGRFAVHFCRTEAARTQNIAEFLAGLDERQEHNGLAVGTGLCHLVRDLVEVRVERTVEVARLKVAGLHADTGQIHPERHGQRLDGHKVALADGLGQRILIRQRLKHAAEISHITSVGCCGYAEHLCAVKVVEDTSVAVGYRVMRFVDDDGAEVVPRERR